MTLWFSSNTIALIQASIKPLWAVRHTHLVKNRIHEFFIEYLCVTGGCKVSITFSPYSPAIGHTMRHLFGRGLTSCCAIRLRNTSLAEIFLRKNISSNLAPLFWNLYVGHFKNNFTGWITNHRCTIVVLELIKNIHIITGEAATKLQSAFSVCGLLCGHTRREFIGFWSGFEKTTALSSGLLRKYFFTHQKQIIKYSHLVENTPYPRHNPYLCLI